MLGPESSPVHRAAWPPCVDFLMVSRVFISRAALTVHLGSVRRNIRPSRVLRLPCATILPFPCSLGFFAARASPGYLQLGQYFYSPGRAPPVCTRVCSLSRPFDNCVTLAVLFISPGLARAFASHLVISAPLVHTPSSTTFHAYLLLRLAPARFRFCTVLVLFDADSAYPHYRCVKASRSLYHGRVRPCG